MKPLAVSCHTAVSALGSGRQAMIEAMRQSRGGLRRVGFETATLDTWLGRVDGLDDDTWPPLPGRDDLLPFDCRNNRLAERALRTDGFEHAVQQAAERFGPARVAVFLGTSTAGILSTEVAYRQRDASGALPVGLHYAGTHNPYSVARFVRQRLRLQGPAAVVSTACSSSAKVFAQAARMIELGLVDAAVVGGVDSLCLTTLYGFHALELVSTDICRPFDAQRKGLSLGEAAAFALLERESRSTPRAQGWLLGCGESSDGHHMSAPHPEGAGAAMAMRQALAQAGCAPGDVDYLNLHGTGTPGNDDAEARAVRAVFGAQTPCSSTKGYSGHTLGAAGALEAGISLLALEQGLAPAGLNVQQLDPALGVNYLLAPLQARLRRVASNSFGFGGSNACLLFGATA